MDAGDWAVRGTAWLALAGYFTGAFLLLRGNRRIAKWVWGSGCDFNTLHILVAFHFTHGWSHAAAVEHVARQSEAVIGTSFGAGIWFNYVFTILWIVDASWLWLKPKSYTRRKKWVAWAIHGFLFFMVMNAAVVFAPDMVRWPSAVLSLVLAVMFFRRPDSEELPTEDVGED
tara:strand:- start:122 stop:637 length:516 start_codon:yes stop_codon:yes gene_type:complete